MKSSEFRTYRMLQLPNEPENKPVTDRYFIDGDLSAVSHWVTSELRPGCDELLCAGMHTAEILKSVEIDAQGLLVTLLQSLLPFTEKEQAQISNQFGSLITTLLQRVERLQQLSLISQDDTTFTDPKVNEENLRKMLIDMVDDVRVVLIELACQLFRLQDCKHTDHEKKMILGRLTMYVYAPLANRLGVWQLKWRLEDTALHLLEPDDYQSIAARLNEKRSDREQYIAQFIDTLKDEIKKIKVDGEVYGRPKHLYGIWKKMQRKGLIFENLYDIRAVRILVESVSDCYSVLAILSMRWRSLPEEYDDYIATPKTNGYRSLHTVIIGPDEKLIEVQIRTHEMHYQNEFGGAAHWRYKEDIRTNDSIDIKVARLRQLLQWKEELHDTGALVEPMDDGEKRVYVFTPQGTVIDLPEGSTPIDFAYAIHSEVGHSARGAKVNDKMTPLGYHLETGDQVHIKTVKGAHPSRDWLRNDLGYIRTRRARERIMQWFKHADYAEHLANGRVMLDRELSRLGLEPLSYDKIAHETHFQTADDMLAAIGSHDYKLSKALTPFRRAQERELIIPLKQPLQSRHHAQKRLGDFKVEGVENLLTRLANCCHPIPGDEIIGFITVGNGVSIHRKNCNNMGNLGEHLRNRLVEVQWGASELTSYLVELQILTYQDDKLLNDISQFFHEHKIKTLKLTMEADKENNTTIQIKLEIPSTLKLNLILSKLRELPNVWGVRRASS